MSRAHDLSLDWHEAFLSDLGKLVLFCMSESDSDNFRAMDPFWDGEGDKFLDVFLRPWEISGPMLPLLPEELYAVLRFRLLFPDVLDWISIFPMELMFALLLFFLALLSIAISLDLRSGSKAISLGSALVFLADFPIGEIINRPNFRYTLILPYCITIKI